MSKIKNILCPIDFSETSNEALEYAVQLAKANGASIHLLSVMEPLVLVDSIPADYNEMVEKMREAREHLLDKAVEELQASAPHLKITSELLTQFDAADAILEAGKKNAADLIVMGSHGRRGLSRVLMGSVAESVMREANCPVLILKLKKDK
jgi:universal stress protein A